MVESNASIFSTFNFIFTLPGLVHQEEEEKDERGKLQAKKVKTTTQRDEIVSTSFHSLWICVAMLLHMVSETMVEAVCTPVSGYVSDSDQGDLQTAVDACLKESSTGNCPNFAAASNKAGCNNGGVNGVIGDWDVSQVTSLSSAFKDKGSFKADISKWDTSSVTTMERSTSSLSYSFLAHLYLILELVSDHFTKVIFLTRSPYIDNESFINQIVLLTFFLFL